MLNPVAVVIDCTSGVSVTRQHATLKALKSPLIALINSSQDSITIAYNNLFDDYLIFPIIEEQFNFRLSLCHRYSLLLLSDNPKPSRFDGFTLKQKPSHIKLASDCADYLQRNLGKAHTLAGLSKELGTNRNTLAATFKTVYGCGVFTWLRRQRLLFAHEQLCSTGANIQTIAYQLGFSDPANFSRIYKQEFGVSPRRTRDMIITLDDEVASEQPFVTDGRG